MDLERIQPLGNLILVKPEEQSSRSTGGLWIPENAKKPTGIGRVVAMGPGLLMRDGSRWPMPDIKPGDRVVFDSKAPFPIVVVDGVELLKLRDDTVLGVIEE